MPKKKHTISEEERRKRLRETARELETSNDPKDFERAFTDVVSRQRSRSGAEKKTAR